MFRKATVFIIVVLAVCFFSTVTADEMADISRVTSQDIPGYQTAGNSTSAACSCCKVSVDGVAASVPDTWNESEIAKDVAGVNLFIEENNLQWNASMPERPVLYYSKLAGGRTTGRPIAKGSEPGMGSTIAEVLPGSFDWRANGGDWTTPIKDQGRCGSCWAFAVTATFESYWERLNNNPSLNPDFAEQYLVSCASNNGCGGGDVSAMDYLVNTPSPRGGVGTVTESVFPYSASNSACKDLSSYTRYKVPSGQDWYYVSSSPNADNVIPPVDDIKRAIYTRGPVSVYMYADNNFDYYDTGIYSTPTTYSSTNHAVVLVGWGHDTATGKDYWIAKNSWGTYWGENGWFRIFTDSNRIGEGAAYVTLPTTTPITLGEALDNTALSWTTDGDGSWTPETSHWYSGGSAAQSTPISRLQTANLRTTVTGPGSLSFYWSVSSEQNYDFLKFILDSNEMAAISGTVDWRQQTFTIGQGTHTLCWTYVKDDSANIGEDCGWVDLVSFSGTLPPSDRTEIGIYQDGIWHLDMDGDGAWGPEDKAARFGAPGWTAVVGDWNGNEVTEIGIYRDGIWYLDMDGDGAWGPEDKAARFGAPGWIGIVGDWDGNDAAEIGVYQNGVWYLDMDGDGAWGPEDKAARFGAPGWIGIVGDWDGNDAAEIGVYQNGVWYLDMNGDGTWSSGDALYSFGKMGWIPVVGKWN